MVVSGNTVAHSDDGLLAQFERGNGLGLGLLPVNFDDRCHLVDHMVVHDGLGSVRILGGGLFGLL